jgi:type VI secretion system secreted protein VgrG
MDDRSSCWIRVMQTWAGNGWGTWILPRIGMEVIVSFISGDPDRPVVTGCLYNGQNRPPYPLPQEKTKSTYKSNSSLGGNGYNEFRFEDKKGQEEIFTHAEKDYNEVVEHDHNTLVHNCQTNTVDVDQDEVVHRDQRMTVDNNRMKAIGVDEISTIGQNRTETVGNNERIMIGKDRQEMVGENERVRVGKDRRIAVKGRNTLDVIQDVDVFSQKKILLRAGESTILIKKRG